MKMRPGQKSKLVRPLLGASQVNLSSATLVPASQLQNMDSWRSQAETFHSGELLFVLPNHNTLLMTAAGKIKDAMSKRGRTMIIKTVC